MMVVPEKAAHFDIHPQRCCYDVCQYCGLKFGMLDTPMHVSQLKTVELQKFAVDFTKFQADSCLCDKCYRYIDRKARNVEINKRKRMEDVEHMDGGGDGETTAFGTPFHKTCFIRNCNKEVRFMAPSYEMYDVAMTRFFQYLYPHFFIRLQLPLAKSGCCG